MANAPNRGRRQGEVRTLEVRVTVPGGQGSRRPARARGPAARLPQWLVIALAGLLVAIAAGEVSPRHDGRRHARLVQAPGAAGVAAAYGYPGQCLSVTILAAHPTYARADFNHERTCGRYSGDATAILRRVDGAWHLILDATAYSCPVTGIPLAVQASLGVCDVAGR